MITQRAKVYYLGPMYPILLAAGSVTLVGFLQHRGWRRAPVTIGAAIVVAGLVTLPLTIPVLAPETFLAYARTLGFQEPQQERGPRAKLPQVYADMFGWRDLALEVARVHASLSPEDRARAAIIGRNYGEAGAIDYFGRALGLPRAISPHNSYWLWGTGGQGRGTAPSRS